MARHKAAWWKVLVTEVEQGGNATEIAQRRGVNVRTLLWWRTQLHRGTRASAGESTAPRLVPLVVKRDVEQAESSMPEIVVERGDIRIRVRGALRASQLEAIVRGIASPR